MYLSIKINLFFTYSQNEQNLLKFYIYIILYLILIYYLLTIRIDMINQENRKILNQEFLIGYNNYISINWEQILQLYYSNKNSHELLKKSFTLNHELIKLLINYEKIQNSYQKELKYFLTWSLVSIIYHYYFIKYFNLPTFFY